jgi:hypothetical protein
MHFERMLEVFDYKYFHFVPGIYGTSAHDLHDYAMKSGVPGSQVDSIWHAVDDGTWWVRDDPYDQPSGDYTPGCWLTMDGWTPGDYKFNDAQTSDGGCYQSVDHYLCSTNDKGGVGVGGRPDDLELEDIPGVFSANLAAEVGVYEITYHVKDNAQLSECEAPKRTVIVKDTLPPEIRLKLGGEVVASSGVPEYHGIGDAALTNGVHSSTGFVATVSDQIRQTLGYSPVTGGVNHQNYIPEGHIPIVDPEGRRLLAKTDYNSNAYARILPFLLPIAGAVMMATLAWSRRRAGRTSSANAIVNRLVTDVAVV